jgi:hypothetical protein
MTLGPRLQVAFSTAELRAIGELARQEDREVRAQIRHVVLAELYRRGLLLTEPRGKEETCSQPHIYNATPHG